MENSAPNKRRTTSVSTSWTKLTPAAVLAVLKPMWQEKPQKPPPALRGRIEAVLDAARPKATGSGERHPVAWRRSSCPSYSWGPSMPFFPDCVSCVDQDHSGRNEVCRTLNLVISRESRNGLARVQGQDRRGRTLKLRNQILLAMAKFGQGQVLKNVWNKHHCRRRLSYWWGCSPCTGRISRPAELWSECEYTGKREAEMSSESFDINYPDVELINQPTGMSCWAASAADGRRLARSGEHRSDRDRSGDRHLVGVHERTAADRF